MTPDHREFFAVDMDAGWERPPGYPPGVEQKILSGSLDEANGRGRRTRLLRFAPGARTSAPVVHAYWEEVFLIAGDFTVGGDEAGRGGETFRPFTYAVRPPGVIHGPFRSDTGCLLFETHRFA